MYFIFYSLRSNKVLMNLDFVYQKPILLKNLFLIYNDKNEKCMSKTECRVLEI